MAKKKTKKRPCLVSDSKYEGKYVVFGASGTDIVASGSNPTTVVNVARRQGISIPSITFVPRKGITCAY